MNWDNVTHIQSKSSDKSQDSLPSKCSDAPKNSIDNMIESKIDSTLNDMISHMHIQTKRALLILLCRWG